MEKMELDLPAEIYRSLEGISNSMLSYTSRGYNHFVEAMEGEKIETREMLMGSAIHDSILLPYTFKEKYISIPKFDKRTKKSKEILKSLKLEKRIPINEDDYQKILNITQIFHDHPTIKNLFSEGYPETSFFWRYDNSQCKGRTDWFREDGIIIDIKTCKDCSLSEFQESLIFWKYDRQAAYYLDGVSQVLKKQFNTFIFIVVEREPPHEIAIYSLDESAINIGRDIYKRDILKYEMFMHLYSQNKKKVYNNFIESITLPEWAQRLENR